MQLSGSAGPLAAELHGPSTVSVHKTTAMMMARADGGRSACVCRSRQCHRALLVAGVVLLVALTRRTRHAVRARLAAHSIA